MNVETDEGTAVKEARGSGWDVVYGPSETECRVEPHFCREWDDSGGCYGTNPNHGMTWEEARSHVADFYARLASAWREKKEEDY